jgi:uncharacterized membrane protein
LSDKKVVLALFKDEGAADSAVSSLKAWDKTDDLVKMNAVGVLVLDDKGEVKTHKTGSRSITKGAGIGLILALLTPVGVTAGVVGGGLLGALHRKGLGLNEEDQDRISTELHDGKAAVGVLANADQADAIMQKMEELGGEPEVHAVPEAAMKQAAAEIPSNEPASPATGG